MLCIHSAVRHRLLMAGVFVFSLAGCNNSGSDDGESQGGSGKSGVVENTGGQSTGTSNTGQPSTAPDVAAAKAQIVAQIPQAAGLSNIEFELLAAGAAAPRLEGMPNQPLTLARLVWDASSAATSSVSRDKLREELELLADVLAPAEIARRISGTQNQGFVSVIQPEWIGEVTCDLQGDQASGVAHVKADGFYAARIHYTAHRRDGKWAIDKFELPLHKIATIRGPDGLWQASGVTTGGNALHLPIVSYFLLPDGSEVASCPVLRLEPVQSPAEEGQPTQIKIFLDDQELKQEQMRAALDRHRQEISRQDPAPPLMVALVAERGLPAEQVFALLRIAADAGFETINARAAFADAQALPAPYGHVDLTLPRTESAVAPEVQQPMHVILSRPADAGGGFQITLDYNLLGDDSAGLAKLHERLASFFDSPEGVEGSLPVQIVARDAITWEQWLQTASACAGRFDAEGKAFHRFPSRVFALRMVEEESLEMELGPAGDTPPSQNDPLAIPPSELDPVDPASSPDLPSPLGDP